jgi:hypothetical protein
MNYIVWVGGVSEYFETLKDALEVADEYIIRDYDDVIIENAETGEVY